MSQILYILNDAVISAELKCILMCLDEFFILVFWSTFCVIVSKEKPNNFVCMYSRMSAGLAFCGGKACISILSFD